MDKTDINTDSEKRGKLLFLAGIITLAIFFNKVFQKQVEISTLRIYLDGLIYFVVAFIGLLWAFNFQIKPKSLLYIFQSSLFVFSESVFVELFFFQKFGRVYEALILLVLLILVFVGIYIAFLMTNVFNVSLFKQLPLLQVGRTSSYLISLLTMYFLTFALLSSSLPVYVLLVLILIAYMIVAFIHYINMGIEGEELTRKTILTTIITMSLFWGVYLTGGTNELSAIVPGLGYYFTVSMITQEQIFRKNPINLTFSMLFIAIMFFVVVFFNLLSS